MRKLISCARCNRQYDASKRSVGERVRCHCGQILVVRPPRGHDARVVRCSSCGAPREGNSPHCRFCGADFTLLEKDLHTVCPKCLSRVSDRGRFCHNCGTRLSAQMVAGEISQLHCPACSGHHALVSRQLGRDSVPAFECKFCGGLWLRLETLERLAERAASEAVFDAPPSRKNRSAASKQQTGSLYRPCAHCRKLMVRRNYGRRSGTIVDICRDHGVWFDCDELSQVLTWIRDGGQADRLVSRRVRESQRAAVRPQPSSGGRDDYDGIGMAAISSLTRIFDLF